MLVDEVRQMAAEVGQVFDQTVPTELSSSDLRAAHSRDGTLHHLSAFPGMRAIHD